MTAACGTCSILFSVRPEDQSLATRQFRSLSESAVSVLSFHFVKRALCLFIEYDREMALVADHNNPGTGMHEILAVGRFHQDHRGPENPACNRNWL